MHKTIAVALSYMLSNLDDVNEATNSTFSEEEVQLILEAFRKEPVTPVHANFNPSPEEILNRLAVNSLYHANNDIDVILMLDTEKKLSLWAFLPDEMEDDESIINGNMVTTPRPTGTVEYMVCDGLPGKWCDGDSFYSLNEAVADFKDKQNA